MHDRGERVVVRWAIWPGPLSAHRSITITSTAVLSTSTREGSCGFDVASIPSAVGWWHVELEYLHTHDMRMRVERHVESLHDLRDR